MHCRHSLVYSLSTCLFLLFAYAPFQFNHDFTPFPCINFFSNPTKQRVPHPFSNLSLLTISISALSKNQLSKNIMSLTGHKTTSITNQKRRCASVLLRPAQSPQHILLRPFLPPLWELFKQCLYHSRHDITRTDRVYSDTVLAPFAGQVATELDDCSFGGVVGGADESLISSGPIQDK
jgi:hypothetical protein